MTVERNFGAIVEQLLKIIPNTEREFREKLQEIQRSTLFRTPEAMPELWRAVMMCLSERISPNVAYWESWQVAAIAIFLYGTDEETDDVHSVWVPFVWDIVLEVGLKQEKPWISRS